MALNNQTVFNSFDVFTRGKVLLAFVTEFIMRRTVEVTMSIVLDVFCVFLLFGVYLFRLSMFCPSFIIKRHGIMKTYAD
jgi:hypothetical protein